MGRDSDIVKAELNLLSIKHQHPNHEDPANNLGNRTYRIFDPERSALLCILLHCPEERKQAVADEVWEALNVPNVGMPSEHSSGCAAMGC